MHWLYVALLFLFLALSLYLVLYSSKLFIKGAKTLGKAAGMSSFATGVLLIGIGTSLPELATSIFSAWQGNTELVIASVVGSNSTNILLIVGLLAAFGGKVLIQKDLLKNELPIFFISTAFFIAVVYDGSVDSLEALLLLGTFCAYLWYLFVESREQRALERLLQKQPFLELKALGLFLLGITGVLAGSYIAIAVFVSIAAALSMSSSIIAVVALVIGTSLPELSVAWQAYRSNETEIAIGNIFGANAINILVVIGIPALIAPLYAGSIVLGVGIPILIAASAIFFVNGLSGQVMRWEGMMMLIFFAFFLIKLAYVM